MIEACARKPEAGLKIFSFQVRVIAENLVRRDARREEIEDIRHSDTHATDTRAPSTLLRIYSDPIS